MTGIADLLTDEDAAEVRATFERVEQETIVTGERIGIGWLDAMRREMLDMEIDVDFPFTF